MPTVSSRTCARLTPHCCWSRLTTATFRSQTTTVGALPRPFLKRARTMMDRRTHCWRHHHRAIAQWSRQWQQGQRSFTWRQQTGVTCLPADVAMTARARSNSHFALCWVQSLRVGTCWPQRCPRVLWCWLTERTGSTRRLSSLLRTLGSHLSVAEEGQLCQGHLL